MPILTQPAFGPGVATVFITVGALIDVWTASWYLAYAWPAGGAPSREQSFWCAGLFLTGVVLVLIGLFVGPIGRAARQAELPPRGAMRAEARIQTTAAATPHPVAAAGPTAPGQPYRPPGY